MFFKVSIAACSGLVIFNASRIAEVATMMLDLGWLVLSAALHAA